MDNFLWWFFGNFGNYLGEDLMEDFGGDFCNNFWVNFLGFSPSEPAVNTEVCHLCYNLRQFTQLLFLILWTLIREALLLFRFLYRFTTYYISNTTSKKISHSDWPHCIFVVVHVISEVNWCIFREITWRHYYSFIVKGHFWFLEKKNNKTNYRHQM